MANIQVHTLRMRAAKATFALVAALLVAVCLLAGAPFAHAVNIETDDSSVGTLSDRYSSLDELATSHNPSDSVVVDTRVAVLTSVNRALDGTEVHFTGEAVGERIKADAGHVWINVVGSGGSSLGVYMTEEQAEHVVNYGDYNTTGTVLDITGTYSVACEQHQGGLDVHASQVSLVDAGGAQTHTFSAMRLGVGVAMSVFGLILVLIFVVLRKRSEKKGDS